MLWSRGQLPIRKKEVQKMKKTRNVRGTIRRGDIFYADLSGTVGSEQGGIRPVLVIQNDAGNRSSNTIIAAAITSKVKRPDMPTHAKLGKRFGLAEDSIVLLEQIRTIDKSRLSRFVGSVDQLTMRGVNRALAISIGSCPVPEKRGGER